jgi:hypothetical protein
MARVNTSIIAGSLHAGPKRTSVMTAPRSPPARRPHDTLPGRASVDSQGGDESYMVCGPSLPQQPPTKHHGSGLRAIDEPPRWRAARQGRDTTSATGRQRPRHRLDGLTDLPSQGMLTAAWRHRLPASQQVEDHGGLECRGASAQLSRAQTLVWSAARVRLERTPEFIFLC